jgi:hypothetical protein
LPERGCTDFICFGGHGADGSGGILRHSLDIEGARMKDEDIVSKTLNEAAAIISEYLEPGLPRDPVATINRLIKVLDKPTIGGRDYTFGKGIWAEGGEVNSDCLVFETKKIQQ